MGLVRPILEHVLIFVTGTLSPVTFLTRAARRTARAMGVDVERLVDGAVSVRRARGAAAVRPLSPRISVVTNEPDPLRLQQRLGHYLAEQQVDWMLRKLRINCVIDAGANAGQFAERVRAGGYTGRIASFEPLPAFVAELRTKAKADPDWQIHPYAVGEEDGEATINVVPGTMSSILPISDFGKGWHERLREEPTAETIQVRRLDSFFDQVTAGIEEPRIFLKLDTQGFDLAAFRGVGDRIGEVLAMMSELAAVPIYDGMPTMTEQLAEYEAAGFDLAAMFPVSLDRPSMRVVEFDAVLVCSPDK